MAPLDFMEANTHVEDMEEAYPGYNSLCLALGREPNEGEIRDLVGAPSVAEEDQCMCGEAIEDCPDAYEHMTHGV